MFGLKQKLALALMQCFPHVTGYANALCTWQLLQDGARQIQRTIRGASFAPSTSVGTKVGADRTPFSEDGCRASRSSSGSGRTCWRFFEPKYTNLYRNACVCVCV